MHRNKTLLYLILITIILTTALLGACQTKKTAGQLIMDVTGESFQIRKNGMFGKDHDFWVFKIRNISRSGKQKNNIGVKGSELQTTSRAMSLKLEDPAGYEWDIVTLAELKRGKKPGQSRRERSVVAYTFAGRMEEKSTMVIRKIRADYKPGDPDFDGSLRGMVLNEKNEVIYTFESNPRLDVHKSPDEGFQVFSIYIDEVVVAVVDSRNGYEVTFFEGLQPTQRTQLAGTISSLFVLMKYGIL